MMTRPLRFDRVQLVTGWLTRSLFGTITSVRSKVSTEVERTEMRLTIPCWPPASTQSPTLIGRSISRMIPATKFDTMF